MTANNTSTGSTPTTVQNIGISVTGEKTDEIKRRRRHWHQHEKLSIISAYDRGELYPVPGKPTHVIDPKSKETLSIFLIEGWKDTFRGLGLIKKLPKQVEPTIMQSLPSNLPDVQSLLVNALLENQKLKEQLNTLKKGIAVHHRKEVNFG